MISILLFVGGCSTAPFSRIGKPPAAPSQIKTEAFRELLSYYSHDIEKKQAASFLIESLPPADVASMSRDDLREHIDYAFLARRTMPWGRDIPWDIFLHYVVAHRVSQEPVQPWRRRFFEELAPRLRNFKTIEEAALEINKWCFGQVGFKPSEPWDQGPLSTLRRGSGRCEEKVILFVAAARSVCIPAREAYTPRWQATDDNHAWVEVWSDGKWHYLGAADPAPAFDASSFDDKLEHSVVVFSPALGRVENSDEKVYRSKPAFTLFNSTSSYAKTGVLDVAVTGKDGAPVPKAEVFVSVYNYGSFKPVARIVCDSEGKGSVSLGRSTVLLTVAKEGKSDFSFVQVRPESRVQAALDIRRDRVPSGDYWMRFGNGTGNKKEPAPELLKAGKTLDMQRKELEAGRTAEAERRKAVIGDYLGIDMNDKEQWDDPLARALVDSGGNVFELMRALDLAPPDLLPTVRTYMEQAAAKDLVEADASHILEDVSSALRARRRVEQAGLEYGDEIFHKMVLGNRIYVEPYSHWRIFLEGRFKHLVGYDLMKTVRAVNSFVADLAKRKRGIFGPLMTPGEVVRLGIVSSDAERAITAAAILRSLGIPARYLEDQGWVEFYWGTQWLPLYPDRPEDLGKRGGSPEADAFYAEPVQLELSFTLKNEPCTGEQVDYFRDFTISRFTRRGYFEALRSEVLFDEEKSAFVLRFPPGKYYLIAARRNDIGEPFVHVIPFRCEPGEKLSFAVKLDLPWSEN